MNIQLHQAVSDITGTTGMAIIRAIVAGEHDPQVLAAKKHHRIKRSEAEIAAALVLSFFLNPQEIWFLERRLRWFFAI
ncbi:hypothetical protein VB735_19300 [Halotia wernerae UHCC 0503]|nr:hypothetical protein [Halotia wernerae UHCC 0503]